MPRKSRALLSYVAVSSAPRQREELAELFCSHTADPRRTLRTLVSRIRREAPGVLITSKNRIGLNEAVWVDCHAFSEAVQESNLTSPKLALYTGEFMSGETLPDCPEYEMWLLGRRVYYQTLYERALLGLARKHYKQGEMEAAHSFAIRLVESNPYLEEAQMLLVQILAARGRFAEARDYSSRFSTLLEWELGVPPTEQFREMVATTLPTSAEDAGGKPPALVPAPVAPSTAERPLLFSPPDLQRRLGNDAQQVQWAILYDWAMVTVGAAGKLWAYQDAAAALETALIAAEKTGAPAADKATILARHILLGRYVDDPLPVQQERLARADALLEGQAGTQRPPLVELAKATLLYREGRYSLAAETAARTAVKFEAAGELQLAGQANTVQGQALLRAGHNKAADTVLRRAQKWLEEAGDIEALGLNIGETAWAALNRGRIEDAFAILEDGLSSIGPSPPPAAEARLFFALAACWNYYYDAEGMESAARKAAQRYRQIGNRALAVRCEIYLLQAERYRFEAEAAQQRLGKLFQKSRHHYDTWLMAWVMALLGQAAFRKGRLDEAESWYGRAYGLRQQTGERQNQVYDLAWTGRLRAALGQYQSALHYTTAAVRQMEQAAGDFVPWEAWDMYLAHAEVLAQNGREPEALSTLNIAYQTLQDFVGQIASAAIRRQVLAFEHSRFLVEAWERRELIPFHKHDHNLI
jgi:DNA-binding SARP family transcriptional activator